MKDRPENYRPKRYRKIDASYLLPEKRKHHLYAMVYRSPANILQLCCTPSRKLEEILELTPNIHPESYIVQMRKSGRNVFLYKWVPFQWVGFHKEIK